VFVVFFSSSPESLTANLPLGGETFCVMQVATEEELTVMFWMVLLICGCLDHSCLKLKRAGM
jgi:hypothetical protein